MSGREPSRFGPNSGPQPGKGGGAAGGGRDEVPSIGGECGCGGRSGGVLLSDAGRKLIGGDRDGVP